MIRVKEDRKNRQVFVSIDNTTNKTRNGLRAALTEIGRENVKHTKNLIKKGPKTGRVYRIKGRVHKASAPGEAPASRSGKLLRSVRARVYGWERMEFGDSAPHGKYLELGTRNMEPRPHLKTTVDERSGDNFIILNESVDRHTKK